MRVRFAPMLNLPRNIPKRLALLTLGAFFVVAGVGHFANSEFYVSIMPPYLPAHLELVYLSGLFEIAGGLGVLLPATRRPAGWGLVALLMAVYPANLHMVIHPEPFVASGTPLWGLYARLPVQFLFGAWAYWATQAETAA